MIPETPELLGASTNPLHHAALATPAQVRARIATMQVSAGTLDSLARMEGTVIRAHLFDLHAASAWISEAARVQGETIDGFLAGDPDAQRAEVVRVWRAFGNFWRALNANALAWLPLRHAVEDAWGHPRSAFERGASARPPVSEAEEELHRVGITWRLEELRDGAASEWRTSTNDPGPFEGWFRARLRDAMRRRYGQDHSSRRILWGWNRRQLGQGGGGESLHRLRIQSGGIWVHPVMATPAAEWNAEASEIASPRWGWNVPNADLGWREDYRMIVDDDGIGYALPASQWYFEILKAPRPGLRAREGGPELSIIDYIVARGPLEILRETMRDVMTLNLRAMQANGLQREDQLFTEAARREMERSQIARARDLDEVRQDRATASAVMGAATGIAAAVSPVAGVVVGAAALVGQLALSLIRPRRDDSIVELDVFGRMMPTFEAFELTDARSTLQGHLRAMGLPEGASEDPAARAQQREAQQREAQQRVDAVRDALGDRDALALFVSAQRAVGRRSVMLTGLDPARGARVFVGDREYTTGAPEVGRARWIEADGVPVWFFGVPEGVTSIRVRYPDGRWRTIELAPVAPQLDSDASPEARTAIVDATPPAGDDPGDGEGEAMGFPSRTVVLVGLSQAEPPHITADGVDVSMAPAPTGDAPRWIDSTLVPGAQGYLFGVPEGTRAVTAIDAMGARTFELGPIALTAAARDRVTVIDARRARALATLPGALKAGIAGAIAFGAYRIFRSAP